MDSFLPNSKSSKVIVDNIEKRAKFFHFWRESCESVSKQRISFKTIKFSDFFAKMTITDSHQVVKKKKVIKSSKNLSDDSIYEEQLSILQEEKMKQLEEMIESLESKLTGLQPVLQPKTATKAQLPISKPKTKGKWNNFDTISTPNQKDLQDSFTTPIFLSPINPNSAASSKLANLSSSFISPTKEAQLTTPSHPISTLTSNSISPITQNVNMSTSLLMSPIESEKDLFPFTNVTSAIFDIEDDDEILPSQLVNENQDDYPLLDFSEIMNTSSPHDCDLSMNKDFLLLSEQMEDESDDLSVTISFHHLNNSPQRFDDDQQKKIPVTIELERSPIRIDFDSFLKSPNRMNESGIEMALSPSSSAPSPISSSSSSSHFSAVLLKDTFDLLDNIDNINDDNNNKEERRNSLLHFEKDFEIEKEVQKISTKISPSHLNFDINDNNNNNNFDINNNNNEEEKEGYLNEKRIIADEFSSHFSNFKNEIQKKSQLKNEKQYWNYLMIYQSSGYGKSRLMNEISHYFYSLSWKFSSSFFDQLIKMINFSSSIDKNNFQVNNLINYFENLILNSIDRFNCYQSFNSDQIDQWNLFSSSFSLISNFDCEISSDTKKENILSKFSDLNRDFIILIDQSNQLFDHKLNEISIFYYFQKAIDRLIYQSKFSQIISKISFLLSDHKIESFLNYHSLITFDRSIFSPFLLTSSFDCHLPSLVSFYNQNQKTKNGSMIHFNDDQNEESKEDREKIIYGMGRPIWRSLYQIYSNRSSNHVQTFSTLFSYLKYQFENFNSKNELKNNSKNDCKKTIMEKSIAVISSLIPIKIIDPNLAIRLVDHYFGTCNFIEIFDRSFIVEISYPSEPIISEVALQLFADHSDQLLENLFAAVEDNFVDRNIPSYSLITFILLFTKVRICKENFFNFSSEISLQKFLSEFFLPFATSFSSQFSSQFFDFAKISFSHFIYLNENIENENQLKWLYDRSAAVISKLSPTSSSYYLIIPVKLSKSNYSNLLISFNSSEIDQSITQTNILMDQSFIIINSILQIYFSKFEVKNEQLIEVNSTMKFTNNSQILYKNHQVNHPYNFFSSSVPSSLFSHFISSFYSPSSSSLSFYNINNNINYNMNNSTTIIDSLIDEYTVLDHHHNNNVDFNISDMIDEEEENKNDNKNNNNNNNNNNNKEEKEEERKMLFENINVSYFLNKREVKSKLLRRRALKSKKHQKK